MVGLAPRSVVLCEAVACWEDAPGRPRGMSGARRRETGGRGAGRGGAEAPAPLRERRHREVAKHQELVRDRRQPGEMVGLPRSAPLPNRYPRRPSCPCSPTAASPTGHAPGHGSMASSGPLAAQAQCHGLSRPERRIEVQPNRAQGIPRSARTGQASRSGTTGPSSTTSAPPPPRPACESTLTYAHLVQSDYPTGITIRDRETTTFRSATTTSTPIATTPSAQTTGQAIIWRAQRLYALTVVSVVSDPSDAQQRRRPTTAGVTQRLQ